MSFATRYGAPSSPFGGLRVTIFTELTVPSATAATASSPSSPPVGTMMRPPFSLASARSSGPRQQGATGEHHHLLSALDMGRQIRSSTDAGAHSIARSARVGNASGSTSGQAIRSASSQACALAGISRRRAGEHEPRYAIGQLAGEHAADRAQRRTLALNGIYTFFTAAVNAVDVFGWHLHVRAGTADRSCSEC